MQLSPSFSSGECQSGEGDEEGEGDASDVDSESDSFFARNSEEIVRPHVIIPSMHSVFQHNDRDHEHQGSLQDEDDGDVDNGWGGYDARPSHHMDSHSRRGEDVYGEDEDEEDDDDDDGSAGSGVERPIEVRRRQLAWADHDLEGGDDEDEEEDAGPPPTPP